MSRRLFGVITAAALVATPAVALAVPNASRPSAATIEPSLLAAGTHHAFVQYDRAVTSRDVSALRSVGITRSHAFRYVDAVAVVASSADLRDTLRLPGVTAVVRDNGLSLNLHESKKALKVARARAAKSAGGLGLTGKGVTVAVIDTGMDVTHPDFAGRIKGTYNFEGGWAFDAYQDGSISNEVAEGSGQFAGVDEVGHGTHVASIVGGSGVASSAGAGTGNDYSGVAPGVNFVSFKVASAVQGVVYDLGWEANTMAAIEYLMEHNKELGVSIVQNSWGIYEVTDPDSEPVIQMVRAAIARGLIFVFSAGNNGPGKNTVGWPGAMGNVITVGSTLKTPPFAMSSFSSRGPQVDVTAPGSTIVAARAKTTPLGIYSAATPPQDRPFYTALSGTSMSSPHVAGVVALMKQAYPRLSGRVAEEILARTAVDLGARGKDDDYGWGFVDAYRASHVAACLARTPNGARERCFSAVRALPRRAYVSDWDTKGNEAPTANGSMPIPV